MEPMSAPSSGGTKKPRGMLHTLRCCIGTLSATLKDAHAEQSQVALPTALPLRDANVEEPSCTVPRVQLTVAEVSVAPAASHTTPAPVKPRLHPEGSKLQEHGPGAGLGGFPGPGDGSGDGVGRGEGRICVPCGAASPDRTALAVKPVATCHEQGWPPDDFDASDVENFCTLAPGRFAAATQEASVHRAPATRRAATRGINCRRGALAGST